MGMTIDEAKNVLFDMLGDKTICEPTEQNKAITVAIKTMQNYEMIQADYEARLKADMVAILTELQLEIEEIEIDNNVPFGFEPVSKTSAFYEGVSASSKIIQQKINALNGTISN